MSRVHWEQLLLEPESLPNDAAYKPWFDAIAQRLLCGCRVMVADVPHRFTEIEFYYHGGKHLDLFTHRDPIQRSNAHWYFHRTNGVYRGGSFKGVDLTFGGNLAFGGVLIRGIEQEGGELVDGPSLTVDHLLKTTEAASVAALDEAIDGRPAWDVDNPVHLVWLPELTEREVVTSARVGLSLKRLRKADAPTQFILRPYRYLSEPRRIAKGKQHVALALHGRGVSAAEIREQTGCTKGALERYVADYEEGKKESNFDGYFGIDLGPKELARLHGLWSRVHGGG